MARLTVLVLQKLKQSDRVVIDKLVEELGEGSNIETILTRIRRLSQAIGGSKVHGIDGQGYEDIATRICDEIGKVVAASLPAGQNSYTELVSWISGTNRVHPIELFTPNYDLLLEEALERAHSPYFDGFTGSHKPFFDPTSIIDNSLPSRWSRLWKIHGSLGWDVLGDTIIRTGERNATQLIYPDHLKYDQISRQPYSALFERLREFLTTPDSLLICTGFSFFDSHISAVLDEALSANNHTAVLAFQYRNLVDEQYAVNLAMKRPNMSVYAQDGAIVHGVKGTWRPGESPSDEWLRIRNTYWSDGSFLLGDFAKLARFFALSQASEFTSNIVVEGRSDIEDEIIDDSDAKS